MCFTLANILNNNIIGHKTTDLTQRRVKTMEESVITFHLVTELGETIFFSVSKLFGKNNETFSNHFLSIF